MQSLCVCLLVLSAACGVRDVECDVVSRAKRSDDVSAYEAVISGLSQQLTQLNSQLTALQNQHDRLEARFESSQKRVAFLAYHQADPFNVASQGIINYNTADVNFGNNLDTTTGVFTCTTPGIYVFFINCMCDGAEEDARILVNGRAVAGCYSYSSNNHDQGAGMAVVQLGAGQQVWVQMYRDGRDVRGSIWHTFVGFLLTVDVE